jgi:hypothetical protein
MALQTFTAGQVLTAAQVTALQANNYNQTVSTKTASYVLVAADKGTRVVMDAAGATTITVNTSLFSAGDTLWIQNIGAGTCTITAGTATVTTSSSLALAQWQGGTLYFTSTGAAIFFLTGSSDVTPLVDSSISATTGSPSTATYTSTFNYKTYQWTGTGSFTTTKAGLVDVFIVGAGGATGNYASTGGGGGGGAIINAQSVYIPVGTCNVTIGAGGAAPNNYEIQGRHGFATAIGVGTNIWTYVAVGGGGGGAEVSTPSTAERNGTAGGSGGGGANSASSAVVGVGGSAMLTGMGFAGGNGAASSTGSGGGGGYSAAGTNGSGTTSGAGGNGLSSTFRDGSTSVGYAGGGGGTGGTLGANGTGGGGTANTGGGGRNSAGGSGVVIIRVRA